MLESASAAGGVTVTGVTNGAGRGDAIRRRREKMSWTKRSFAERFGISRGTLDAVEADDPSVRETSYARVENALAELEEELGFDKPDAAVVRFVVRGVYGADSLVVEGPVENIAELERSVDRIMRRLRDGDDNA